jgi:hypothetical protein
MGAANKSGTFLFLKDWSNKAKKGDKKFGYWADDWKDIEFRHVNSLGVIDDKFWIPMTEIDKTMKKVDNVATPKPNAKEIADKIKAQKEKAPETKPTETAPTTPPAVEEKKSIFTTKNILIGVGVLVVLFVGVKMLRKKK